jgi:hypothetical protein
MYNRVYREHQTDRLLNYGLICGFFFLKCCEKAGNFSKTDSSSRFSRPFSHRRIVLIFNIKGCVKNREEGSVSSETSR